MRLLAACPNVSVEVATAMFDHQWVVESIRPLVLETLDAFGTERAMFASNGPVDRLHRDHATHWHAFEALIAGASGGEKAALLRENAGRIHRIRGLPGARRAANAERMAARSAPHVRPTAPGEMP